MQKLMAFVLSLTLICWQIHIPAAMAQSNWVPSINENNAIPNQEVPAITEPNSTAPGNPGATSLDRGNSNSNSTQAGANTGGKDLTVNENNAIPNQGAPAGLPSITEPNSTAPSTPGATSVNRGNSNSNSTQAGANTGGKDLTVTADYISMLTMISAGLVTMNLIARCPKFSYDTTLAAIGGAAYIFGEIQSIMAYKDYNDDMAKQYEIKKGEANQSQVAELEDMKAMYEKVHDAAKTKYTMQMAAGVAWSLAAAAAAANWFALKSEKAACVSGFSMAASTGCQAAVPLSTLSVADIVTVAATAVSSEAEREATDDAPFASSAQCTKGTAQDTFFNDAMIKAAQASTTECTTEGTAKCTAMTPTTAACIPNVKLTCGACTGSVIAMKGPCHTYLSHAFLARSCCTAVWGANLQNPTIRYIAQNPIMFKNMIGQMMPVDSMLEDFGIKKFDFNSSVAQTILENSQREKNNEINRYFNYHEKQKVLNFDNKSITYDEYKELRGTFEELESSMGEEKFSNAIDMVIAQGIDLIVPSAHANPMSFWSKTAGLAAVAVGIILGMVSFTWLWLDSMMATPGKRALVFAAFATTAFATAEAVTKPIIEKMESNTNKITAVLKQFKKASAIKADGPKNSAVPGGKGGTGLGSSGSVIPKGSNFAAAATPIEFPCLSPGEGGKCNKPSSVLAAKQAELTGIDFSGLGSASSSVAALGDNLAGGSSVNVPATLANASSLNGSAALAKKLLANVENQFNQANPGGPGFAKQRDDLFNKLLGQNKDFLNRNKDKDGVQNLLASVAKGPEREALSSNATGAYKAKEFQMPSFSMPSSPSYGAYKTVDTKAEVAALPTENIADVSEFKVNTQDIAKAPDVSLFQVISTRYWKTGFNLLLEKEEPLKKVPLK